ncbi:extracellular calcium-sensing receptor-like [Actinia tenebrosa]|uniref:Extracellular calcium-sensing receptor-like n=1 Tax=Actinia tenebrosa TaxID=6105 RepID=A0A6P8GZ99_ACTTE|nr:extracellular calcium-sensing receptor-like [Actinia tenebrosa]
MNSFILFALISVMPSPSKCSQIFDFKTSLFKTGDILLQGLFPITYKDHTQDTCTKIYKDGIMWSMAMVYAVESINNQSSFLPNNTLGYKIDNTCYNIPSAMSNAIEIVAKYRPNSVCYPQSDYCHSGDGLKSYGKITAVIGPALSWIAIPIASLLGLYDIPQISYAATSRILSDKTRYKSFLRTVPSDEYQAKAMADFVRHFEWNFVFLIASDDDYGKMGAATFKKTAMSLNVCIAHDEYIPFNSDMAKEYIYNALVTFKNSERAKVVIVFSYAEQGELLLQTAHKLNITNRTWITSDAWSSTVTKFNVSKSMLEGVFTFSIRSKKVNRFIEYINNLQIRDVKHIPWFIAYMEQVLDCTSSNHSNGKRTCSPTETLPSGHTINTEAIANVIDAVNATAHALMTMLSCAQGVGCRHLNDFSPQELLQYIKNTSFQGTDHASVEFNVNGDRTFSGYTIRNVQVQGNGVGYVDVGFYFWSQLTNQKPNFEINTSLIKWSGGNRPLSNCFRVCKPGERVVGQSECCWNCQKCEKGSYSSVAGALSCTKCNDTHYANEERTACLVRAIVHLNLSTPEAISILTISMIGVLINMIIIGIFIRYRSTPVVIGSTLFHTVLFFTILYLSFMVTIMFIVRKPSNKLCSGVESLHELLIMLYPAFLFSKTRAVNKKIRSAVTRLQGMRQDWSQVLLVGCLVVLQLILITVRQCASPSVVHFLNQEDGTRLLECKQFFPISRILAIAFPCAVLIIATFISFKERNQPENFNEAKFISFTTILLGIILIAFIPTYRYVTGISRILVVTFTFFITAFSCMGCLFLPKLYIILLHPERNVLSNSDPNDEAQTSTTPEPHNVSARTSVTDDLSPDLNDNPQPSRFLNVNNEKKGARVISFSNHGLASDDSLRDAVKDSTNNVTSNGRKRSRTSPGAQVTFELSTVAETSEDGSPWSPALERHVNEEYKENTHQLDCPQITKNTPRAFTVI